MSKSRLTRDSTSLLFLVTQDPAVDRIPAIQMDLDFSDGMSVVVMPKASATLLVDCRADAPVPALDELEITQTLDDREAARGVLKLEVTARAKGLVPSLDDLLGAAPPGFIRANPVDNGVQVLDLDTSTPATRPVSERSWTIEYTADPKFAPDEFTFPAPKIGAKSVAFKRYADADIVDAQATVPVAITTPGPARWPLLVAGGGVLLTAAAMILLLRRTGRKPDRAPLFHVPDEVTPVGAIALLRRIGESRATALGDDERLRIADAAREIERRYFAPGATAAEQDASLRTEVKKWADLADSRSSGRAG